MYCLKRTDYTKIGLYYTTSLNIIQYSRFKFQKNYSKASESFNCHESLLWEGFVTAMLPNSSVPPFPIRHSENRKLNGSLVIIRHILFLFKLKNKKSLYVTINYMILWEKTNAEDDVLGFSKCPRIIGLYYKSERNTILDFRLPYPKSIWTTWVRYKDLVLLDWKKKGSATPVCGYWPLFRHAVRYNY